MSHLQTDNDQCPAFRCSSFKFSKMAEPAEFSAANDPPEEEQRSPYMRMKSKVSRKINKKFDSLTRDIGEELDEHGEQLDSATGVVNDLVEPETLQR